MSTPNRVTHPVPAAHLSVAGPIAPAAGETPSPSWLAARAAELHSSPSSIPVIGCLLRPARERGLSRPLATWTLLRPVARAGRVLRREAIRYLMGTGLSHATVYRHLRAGEGILWRSASSGHLYLVGARALARAWGLGRMDPRYVLVPLERVVSVSGWNGLAFHSVHPGPPPLRLTAKRKLTPGRTRHPVARATLEDLTGILRRSQYEYGRQRGPDGELLTESGYNYSTRRVLTRDRSRMVLRRLGNTYTRNLPTRGYGQGKAFNRNASGGSSAKASPSPRGRGPRRRYFDTPKALIRAREGRRRVFDLPFLRFPRRQHRRVGLAFPAPAITFWEPCPAPQREFS